MKVSYVGKIVKGQPTPAPPVAGKTAAELARFGDRPVRIVVEDVKATRSLAQNSRYWTLIVPAFAEYAGNELFSQYAELRGTTPKDSAHNVLKAHLLGTFDITLPDGSVVTVERSTASLSVAEFAEYQDRAERFLNSLGVYLPAAQEAA